MTLREILDRYRPETWGDTRGNDWPSHARFLWETEYDRMVSLTAHMREIWRWPGGPVEVDDGVVQDAHHRLVAAVELAWWEHEIPVAA